ncbi:MAG: phosphatase PAP2 family protein [Clostridiales bacterium]|nr:phosphatase PAP2 family protein [Clostridiales bacterium]
MQTKSRRILYISLTLFFIATLTAGTFLDLQIAESVYIEYETFSVFFTMLGVLLFNGSFVFLDGALMRKFLSKEMTVPKKILASVICIYLAFSTSALGSASILNGLRTTFGSSIVAGLIIYGPLFIGGFILNRNRYDRSDVIRIILILVIITVAFFFPWLVKALVLRPRYRVTLLGYEGISFVPWYRSSGVTDDMVAALGLYGNDVYSFFSGHALQAVLNIIILPSFACVFGHSPRLEKALLTTALILAPFIMASRMILGDHYLSDISVGALVGIVLCLMYERLADRFIIGPGRARQESEKT